MEPALEAELAGARRDTRVDPTDDVTFIEALSPTGHIGHHLEEEDEDRAADPAAAWLVTADTIAVSLAFGQVLPVIAREDLTDHGLDVIVTRDADGATLHRGEAARI